MTDKTDKEIKQEHEKYLYSLIKPVSVKYLQKDPELQKTKDYIQVLESYPDISILDNLFAIEEQKEPLDINSEILDIYYEGNKDEKTLIYNSLINEMIKRKLYLMPYYEKYMKKRADYGMFEDPEIEDIEDDITESKEPKDPDSIVYFDSIKKNTSKSYLNMFRETQDFITNSNLTVYTKQQLQTETQELIKDALTDLNPELELKIKDKETKAPEDPEEQTELKENLLQALRHINSPDINIYEIQSKSAKDIQKEINESKDFLLKSKVDMYLRTKDTEQNLIENIKGIKPKAPTEQTEQNLNETHDDLNSAKEFYTENVSLVMKQKLPTENTLFVESIQDDKEISIDEVFSFFDKQREIFNNLNENIKYLTNFDYIKKLTQDTLRKDNLIRTMKEQTLFENYIIAEGIKSV